MDGRLLVLCCGNDSIRAALNKQKVPPHNTREIVEVHKETRLKTSDLQFWSTLPNLHSFMNERADPTKLSNNGTAFTEFWTVACTTFPSMSLIVSMEGLHNDRYKLLATWVLCQLHPLL